MLTKLYTDNLDDQNFICIDSKDSIYVRPEELDGIKALINGLEIDFGRIPERGESLDLHVGDYWLECIVKEVSTVYVKNNNRNVDRSRWGVRYQLRFDRIEVMQRYRQPVPPPQTEQIPLKKLCFDCPELSRRTVNTLSAAGIFTIGDLIRYTENELKGLRNFGLASLGEVKKLLKNFGYRLR